jgi:WD40 repeat protein
MSAIKSRVRNCFAPDPKKDELFTEFKATSQAGDHQYIKANTKYFGVPLRGGGGPVLVWRHDKPCRIPSGVPKVAGHAGAVTDMDFHPFNQQLLATGSADATVKLWDIPETMTENLTKPLVTLEHSKRIVFTQFHPTASNILAVADFNKQLKIWDISKSDEALYEGEYKKSITDVKWNYDGSMLGTTSKDAAIRVFDPRAGIEKAAIIFKDTHKGTKPAKILFVNSFNRIYSFGGTKSQSRQCKVWDLRSGGGSKPMKKLNIDSASGAMLPFYDRSTNLIFIGGKGESQVRVMEAFKDEPFAMIHNCYRFNGSAMGYCVVPKRILDTKISENCRLLRLKSDSVEALRFRIPRKSASFQKDLYPDDIAGVPSMTAEEWAGGMNKDPVLMEMDPKKRAAAPGNATGMTFKMAKSRAELEAELEAAKYKIRTLTAEVELYKGQLAE